MGLSENIFNVNKLMGFVHFSIIFVSKLRSVLTLSVPVSGSEKTSLQECMKDACMMKTQSSPTSSPVVQFATFSMSTTECSSKCLNECTVYNVLVMC